MSILTQQYFLILLILALLTHNLLLWQQTRFKITLKNTFFPVIRKQEFFRALH